MKRDFQAKFLMHMASKNKRDGSEGFTLIELLVVIIIIGVLAAIALPSLLAQVNKAKQSEARQNVGAMNRAQQAFILESTNFATTLADLGIGIQKQTVNYYYDIGEENSFPGAQEGLTAIIANRGTPLKGVKNLKSYGGVTATYNQKSPDGSVEALSIGTVCEGKNPISVGDADGTGTGNAGANAYPKPAQGDFDQPNKKLNCADATKWKNLGGGK